MSGKGTLKYRTMLENVMSRAGVIGLARVVLSSHERPFLVEPMGSGLRGVTLRFAHEVRSETDYFKTFQR